MYIHIASVTGNGYQKKWAACERWWGDGASFIILPPAHLEAQGSLPPRMCQRRRFPCVVVVAPPLTSLPAVAVAVAASAALLRLQYPFRLLDAYHHYPRGKRHHPSFAMG
mmetsp:Transcript_38202/g.59688  ORF Transcript_38202/g.59688 Transcript_38202/m.59688 type:complete len:110 (-) Transcript_38202:312-641(-)